MQMDNQYRYAGIDPCEVCNGLGFGVTLYTQGCSHHCEGCHNPSTWDPDGGKIFDGDAASLLFERFDDPNIRRLTISGGEPFEAHNALAVKVAAALKGIYPEKKLWIYTGYTFEELMAMHDSDILWTLSLCDVLVDGPFILAERDITLPFRGSRNQRIIDVPATLKAGRVIELEVA